jgi:hypothetical protein
MQRPLLLLVHQSSTSKLVWIQNYFIITINNKTFLFVSFGIRRNIQETLEQNVNLTDTNTLYYVLEMFLKNLTEP